MLFNKETWFKTMQIMIWNEIHSLLVTKKKHEIPKQSHQNIIHTRSNKNTSWDHTSKMETKCKNPSTFVLKQQTCKYVLCTCKCNTLSISPRHRLLFLVIWPSFLCLLHTHSHRLIPAFRPV